MNQENSTQQLTPTNYFEYVKNQRNISKSQELNEFRENALYLIEKYRMTNQVSGMKKLMFAIDMIEKEKEAISLGIDTFVYLKDIRKFIANVSDEVVKIIRLEDYPREIPDDIVEKYVQVKDVFHRFYVVFTDYTGEAESQVEKSRRDKDPILFGAFHDDEEGELNEKFYYIGDWIDEYCDLTLEKMVEEMKVYENRDISHDMFIPSSIDELREELDKYVYHRGTYVKRNDLQKAHSSQPTKKSGNLFAKFKSWWKREK